MAVFMIVRENSGLTGIGDQSPLFPWDQGVGPGTSDNDVPVTLPESLRSYNFVKDIGGYPSKH